MTSHSELTNSHTENRNKTKQGRWRRASLVPVVVALLFIAGCASPQAAPDANEIAGVLSAMEVTATARALVTPTETAVPTTAVPSETPDATPTPVEPTATAEPTAAPTAGPSPTPTLSAPAPIGVIEQAPYAESECSDKYPCNDDVAGWEARMRLPEGFTASYYARVDGQPNSITFGPDGLLYVATMDGSIYTVDEAGNITTALTGLMVPTGLAFQPGTERLFISNRVLEQNVDGESQVSVLEDGELTTLIGGLPCCYTSFHAANGIAFGPDGYGYVAVGARADHGEILGGPNSGEQDERSELEASILRFNPESGEVAPYARGFRNAYDIAWDASGRLFATDNGPDFGPPEEFHVVQPGEEHGYPWYECEGCFSAPPDVDIVPPAHTFEPHTSPTGITAYLGSQFPGYHEAIFVTLWSAFEGAQKIVYFAPGGVEAADWATGFAAPIDLTVGPDGSLYVADWATGIIFEIRYTG